MKETAENTGGIVKGETGKPVKPQVESEAEIPLVVPWSLERISLETGVDRRIVRNLMSRVQPAPDGGYWLKDFVEILRGGAPEARVKASVALARQQEAAADREELNRDKEFKRVLEAGSVLAAWEELIVPAKERFQNLASKMKSAAGLSEQQAQKIDQEVTDILTDLTRTPNYNRKVETQESEEE